jgi:hypothetical protein
MTTLDVLSLRSNEPVVVAEVKSAHDTSTTTATTPTKIQVSASSTSPQQPVSSLSTDTPSLVDTHVDSKQVHDSKEHKEQKHTPEPSISRTLSTKKQLGDDVVVIKNLCKSMCLPPFFVLTEFTASSFVLCFCLDFNIQGRTDVVHALRDVSLESGSDFHPIKR